MPGEAKTRDELDTLIAEGLACCEEMKPPSRLKQALTSFFSPEEKSINPGDGPEESATSKGKAADRTSPKALNKTAFNARYQAWYSRALRVVQQLLPDRYDEFRDLYRLDSPPQPLTEATYRVSDFIHGVKAPTSGFFSEPIFETVDAAQKQFAFQIDILMSARSRLDSALADIEGVLQSALLDDELGTATELLEAKHLRSAGVIAGVVLERHLKSLITAHEIAFQKNAQIANLNDALKNASVYDIPQWRQIQRLGDIRNLCGHDGDREPKKDEVQELILETKKIIDTVS
jgi:hypothetical protein